MSRRPGVTHDVKCWPSSFTEVISGKKTLDVRRVNPGPVRSWTGEAEE